LRAQGTLQHRALAVPARRGRREGDQGSCARLGQRPHRDRLVTRLPGPVRVARLRFRIGGRPIFCGAWGAGAARKKPPRGAPRGWLLEGPATPLTFPNVFLGETNIAIVEPVSVEECVHWHTPMFLKGVPEFRGRLLRMAEAGMGPASFLMPEDLMVASRNQLGLEARGNEWIELRRGLTREYI